MCLPSRCSGGMLCLQTHGPGSYMCGMHKDMLIASGGSPHCERLEEYRIRADHLLWLLRHNRQSQMHKKRFESSENWLKFRVSYKNLWIFISISKILHLQIKRRTILMKLSKIGWRYIFSFFYPALLWEFLLGISSDSHFSNLHITHRNTWRSDGAAGCIYAWSWQASINFP